jgi:hypothetical protein
VKTPFEEVHEEEGEFLCAESASDASASCDSLGADGGQEIAKGFEGTGDVELEGVEEFVDEEDEFFLWSLLELDHCIVSGNVTEEGKGEVTCMRQ